MAPRRSRANSPEFPILEANALYPGQIKGDGNCLFNALSDQLYGTQELHEVLRTQTIEHMKQNAAFYRQYMTVNTVRRNPKRKTAAAVSARLVTTACTEEELQRQFEQHVEKMGQPGEWADNMEVSAFASAFHVHVRLWQTDYTILISPSFDYEYDRPGAVDDRQTLHIAYHTWEHYSSVRNNSGPHTGVPDVNVTPRQTHLRKRPSPSISGSDEDDVPRARKRRSPLPLFDSDSTPECTESSSDESNGPTLSQTPSDVPDSEQGAKPQKLTIKLRCLRTTDSPQPAEPVETVKPVEAAEAVKSAEPAKSTKLVEHIELVKPTEPIEPAKPVERIEPVTAIPPPTVTPPTPLPPVSSPAASPLLPTSTSAPVTAAELAPSTPTTPTMTTATAA